MRLLSRIRGHSGMVAVILVLVVLNGLVPAAVVAVSERVLASLTQPESLGTSLLSLVGLAVLAPVLQVARAYLSRRLAWRHVHELRLEVHRALHARPDDRAAGDRLALLINECDELNVALSTWLTGVRAPLTIVSVAVAATWLAPELSLRLAVAVPLIVGVAVAGGRLVRHLTQRWRVARADLFVEATDQYNGLLTTLDHHAVDAQCERLASVSARDAQARSALEWGKVVPGALLQALLVLLLAWLLWAAADRVAVGARSMSEVGAFFVAIALLRAPVLRLSDVWSQWARARASLERVDVLVSRKVSSDLIFSVDLQVESKGLPGRLEPFSLRVEQGRKVAVVGASASGKSSLLSVLAGRAGQDSARAGVVVCRQEPWIFGRTLRENLRLGDPLETSAAEASLTQLGLHDLIDRLDRRVGEQGMALSGGQRQRVALARALLVPDVPLLLDEATSEVEPAIAAEIARLLGSLDRTVVMATHERWFPALADEVLWMEGGRIRARGPHDTLLQDPAYRSRWGAP